MNEWIGMQQELVSNPPRGQKVCSILGSLWGLINFHSNIRLLPAETELAFDRPHVAWWVMENQWIQQSEALETGQLRLGSGCISMHIQSFT